jgi:predicted permease
LAPALGTLRAGLQSTLQEGGRGSSGVRHRLQGLFVVVEMAMTLVLLVGAGLMIRSLGKLWSVNPGFNPRHVITFAISRRATPGAAPDAIRAAMRRLQDTVAAVPGVEAAALNSGAMPMRGDSELPFWIDGQPKPATNAEMKTSLFYVIEPDYLKAMEIPLERGRFLTHADNEHAPFVIVIDEQFARLNFAGQNPIGRRLHLALLNQTAEIVGIAGHVKQWGLSEDEHSPIQAQFYMSVAQVPDQFMPLVARGGLFVVRTQRSPEIEISAIRRALGKIESDLVVYETQTMDRIIANSLAARRFAMVLLGIFAGLALTLSCVGIYGVISYLAGQRTHEIGIRMALGAERDDVLRLILGHGAKMALIGVGAGIGASLGLAGLMAKLLFGVSAYDPLTFLTVAGLLVSVALAASYIPARRAMRVDPIVALRYE